MRPTPPEPDLEEVRRALVSWFRRGHRDMPWRRTRDPYAIWISEIMLQQTRVETVTPYYQRWMSRFPSVSELARAPLDEVLAAWAGLGYYTRARNLHAAAGEIAVRYQGRFPDEPEAVRALPGIGPYTAGAILSIAFDQPAPILDGNVARVLSRLWAIEAPPQQASTRKRLWALAAALVPPDAASAFNQGMMELGATVCSPRAPRCAACPLGAACRARAEGAPERYPAARLKRPPTAVDQVALLLESDGQLLLLRRLPSGLWGGLWEPPRGELTPGEDPQAGARRLARETTGLRVSRCKPMAPFEHLLTHRRMRFHPFQAMLAERPPRLCPTGYDAARWIAPARAGELGVAAWTTKLLQHLVASPPRRALRKSVTR